MDSSQDLSPPGAALKFSLKEKKKKSGILKTDGDFCIYVPRNKNPNEFARRVMRFFDRNDANVYDGNCWMLCFTCDVEDSRKQLTSHSKLAKVAWNKMAKDCYVAITSFSGRTIQCLTDDLVRRMNIPGAYEIGRMTAPISMQGSDITPPCPNENQLSSIIDGIVQINPELGIDHTIKDCPKKKKMLL